VVLQVEKRTYEAKTQEIAKQLLAATRRIAPFPDADQMRWDDKLLAWAMGNQGCGYNCFASLTVCLLCVVNRKFLPTCRNKDESVELPAALKGMLNFASPDSMPGQVAATTVASC